MYSLEYYTHNSLASLSGNDFITARTLSVRKVMFSVYVSCPQGGTPPLNQRGTPPPWDQGGTPRHRCLPWAKGVPAHDHGIPTPANMMHFDRGRGLMLISHIAFGRGCTMRSVLYHYTMFLSDVQEKCITIKLYLTSQELLRSTKPIR